MHVNKQLEILQKEKKKMGGGWEAAGTKQPEAQISYSPKKRYCWELLYAGA